MQQKVYEKNKWTRIEKLTLLNIITPFLLASLQFLPFLTKKLIELSSKLGIPLLTTRLLIVLAIFVIVTLFLSLLYILKKEKVIIIKPEKTKHSNLPIIEDESTKTQTFKPLKEEIELLLLYKGDKKLFEKDLLKLSPFSTDKTKLYFTKLCSNGFIKVFPETDRQYLTINMVGGYRYALTQKGREYLHENNLLD